MGELPAFVAGGLLTLEYGVSGAAVARSWGDKVAYAAHSLGMNNTSFLNYEHASMMAGVVQAACVLLLLGGMSIGTKAINTITVTKVSGVCDVQLLQCGLRVVRGSSCVVCVRGMWYSRVLEYKALYALRLLCGTIVCVLSVVHLRYLSTLFLPPPPTSLSSHPLPSRPCFSSSKVIVVIFMIVVGFTKFDPELLHPLVPPAHNFEPTAEDKANVSAVGREREECTAGVGSSSIVFNHHYCYLPPTPSTYSSIPPLSLHPRPRPRLYPSLSIPFFQNYLSTLHLVPPILHHYHTAPHQGLQEMYSFGVGGILAGATQAFCKSSYRPRHTAHNPGTLTRVHPGVVASSYSCIIRRVAGKGLVLHRSLVSIAFSFTDPTTQTISPRLLAQLIRWGCTLFTLYSPPAPHPLRPQSVSSASTRSAAWPPRPRTGSVSCLKRSSVQSPASPS